MSSRLPSDALKPTNLRRAAALAVAGIVVVVGLSIGGVALAQAIKPGLIHRTVVAASVLADTVPTLSGTDAAAVQQAADAQHAQIVAAAKAQIEAAAVRAAAAAQAEVQRARESSRPAVPAAAAPAPAAPSASATPDPFRLWLEHPTFTCPAGRAPGWLNRQGIPTSCVAN